ncbi:MAG TPA: hypothetical protein PL060_06435, partial [bacterium]|nr:hypothetical protein [bacterium]
MKRIMAGMVCVFLMGSFCGAQVVKVQPWKKDVTLISKYLTVPIDELVNHKGFLNVSENRLIVGNIPFQLSSRSDANCIFMKDVGWKDWQKDPSSYYSAYDAVPTEPDPTRMMFHIPVDYYSAVYVLASCENDKNLSNVLTLRIGKFGGGHGMTKYTDFVAQIPRADSPRGGIGLIKTETGNVFLVKIPLDNAIWQEFKNVSTIDVDITKEIRLAMRRPDPCRYQTRPLGLPSGIHIYGITFERAPMKMELYTDEAGHVFNEPQIPQFNVVLTKMTPIRQCDIEAKAVDYYGNVTAVTISDIKIPN